MLPLKLVNGLLDFPLKLIIGYLLLYPSDGTSLIDNVVENITKMGVVVVCAAGNEGEYGFRTINAPASSKSAIAVGAVDSNLNLAYFSSKRPVGYGENLTIKPDIVAPSLNIYSTYPTDLDYNGDGYAIMSGTSMDTSHVSGVVALMLQINETLNPMKLRKFLKKPLSTSVRLARITFTCWNCERLLRCAERYK